jgi:phosphatidylglycerophosphatase C
VKVVVFDFDGTLVSRDSFIDFSVRYCLRRPWRLLLVGPLLPFALLWALRSERTAGSVLLWAMTVGASTRRFVLALRSYSLSTLPHYARDAIFEELTRHLRAGHRVVIATGSVPLLVRGLLAARNLGRLPIVGTRLRRKAGGLVTEVHCTGKVKVAELRRRFGILEWATVYTNSFADSPLLSHAQDITLVWPSKRSLLATQRLIVPGTTLRVLRPHVASQRLRY